MTISGCNKCPAIAVMGDRLATIDMDRRVQGLLCPFFGGREGRKPKQLQSRSTDVDWPVIAIIIITLQVRDEHKKVKASHTQHRALGPELIPVYRQSVCR